jgi:phage tail-like protein
MGQTGERPEAHPAFRFAVQIEGLEGAVFNECTLPSLEIDMISYKEGGYNNGMRELPGQVKTGRLVLKSGIASSSAMLSWYKKVLADPEGAVKHVTVVLYDSTHSEVMRWNFIKAFPVKWTGSTFKSSDNTIAIESIELAYEAFF